MVFNATFNNISVISLRSVLFQISNFSNGNNKLHFYEMMTSA